MSRSRTLDRRRFLLTTATGLVAAGTGVQLASAATDDDLAVANFGLASSYLAADFYAKALPSGKLGPEARDWLRAGRAAALGHARELTTLLTGAGDTPAAAEDFEFVWPADHVHDRRPHPLDRARRAAAGAGRLPAGGRDGHGAELPRAVRQPRRELRGAGRPLSPAPSSRSPRQWTSRPPARRSRTTSGRRILMRRQLAALALVLVVAVAVATGASARSEATGPLTIYAAASLTEVFRAFDGGQNYNFAGSNALETQIRNGAPADVFASAAPLNTQRLFRAGLVDKPVTFTANRLALIVPKSNPAGIRSIYDLRSKPVKLVVAAPAVPVGGYTLTVLRKMGLSSVLSKVGQPRVGREGGDGQGRARPGRRGVRLRHRRAPGQRPGDGRPDPRVGAAAGAVRDRRRRRSRRTRRPRRRGSTRSSPPAARRP